MGRRSQRSKRSRKHRKQAIFSGLHPKTGHPSHVSSRLLQVRNLSRTAIKMRHLDELEEVKLDE